MTDTQDDTQPVPDDKPDKTTRAPRKSNGGASTLSGLTDVDLVRADGTPAPLSAQTENLQATVVSSVGRALVKVAVRGYIGEEPVTILAEDVGEFAELVAALEKAAVAQRKEFAKKD